MTDLFKELSAIEEYKDASGGHCYVATLDEMLLTIPVTPTMIFDNIANSQPSYKTRPNGLRDLVLNGIINNEPR